MFVAQGLFLHVVYTVNGSIGLNYRDVTSDGTITDINGLAWSPADGRLLVAQAIGTTKASIALVDVNGVKPETTVDFPDTSFKGVTGLAGESSRQI